MCGRFTQHSTGHEVAQRFGLADVPNLVPHYNVAPSQTVAVVGRKANSGARGLAMFRWGFIPHWANDDAGPRPINAKSETVATNPAFRDSFRSRRCLIPTNGFYEWEKAPGGKKLPHLFRAADGQIAALAGLWDIWAGPSGKVFSCVVLTTNANSLVKPFHDRMPVILPESAWDTWLDPAVSDPAQLEPLLRPYPAELLESVRVSTAVNNTRHDAADCITPVPTA